MQLAFFSSAKARAGNKGLHPQSKLPAEPVVLIDNGFSFTFIRKLRRQDQFAYDLSVSESSSSYGFSGEKTTAGRRQVLLDLIRKNSSLTTEDLSKQLGVSVPTVARDLKCLQTLGVLKRVGANKNGYWKVIKAF